MAQPTLNTGDDTVAWEIDVTDSSLLQSLAYVFPSIFGGALILVGGLLLWFVVSALLDGNLARAVGIVAFAVLALVSRRYLLALPHTNLTDSFWIDTRGVDFPSGVCSAHSSSSEARSCTPLHCSPYSSPAGCRSYSPQPFRQVAVLT